MLLSHHSHWHCHCDFSFVTLFCFVMRQTFCLGLLARACYISNYAFYIPNCLFMSLHFAFYISCSWLSLCILRASAVRRKFCLWLQGGAPVGGGLELGGLGGDLGGLLGEGRVNESVVRYSNETNPPTACCRAGGEGDAKSIPQKMMLFKLWALGLSV